MAGAGHFIFRLVPEGRGGVRGDGTEVPRASTLPATASAGLRFGERRRTVARRLSGAQCRRTRNPLCRTRRGPRFGQQLASAVRSPAGRGNLGEPRGPGTAAARPRPGRPASAYRCRPPGHAESGAAGLEPALGDCQSYDWPGGGGGWRVEIGAGGPRQSRSRADPT